MRGDYYLHREWQSIVVYEVVVVPPLALMGHLIHWPEICNALDQI
jgi:hypothetical protein